MDQTTADLWVFGYGSLMWDPGFPYTEVQPATLTGYHRALCIISLRNRGTAERPGLVLGLDRGGSCRGRVFRIAGRHAPATRAYLHDREMFTGAYRAKHLSVRIADGERIAALVYVARRDHPQYAAPMPDEDAARLVVQGRGSYGSSLDYLKNVVRHLDEFGIVDGPLHRVLAVAEAMMVADRPQPHLE